MISARFTYDLGEFYLSRRAAARREGAPRRAAPRPYFQRDAAFQIWQVHPGGGWPKLLSTRWTTFQIWQVHPGGGWPKLLSTRCADFENVTLLACEGGCK